MLWLLENIFEMSLTKALYGNGELLCISFWCVNFFAICTLGFGESGFGESASLSGSCFAFYIHVHIPMFNQLKDAQKHQTQLSTSQLSQLSQSALHILRLWAVQWMRSDELFQALKNTYILQYLGVMSLLCSWQFRPLQVQLSCESRKCKTEKTKKKIEKDWKMHERCIF